MNKILKFAMVLTLLSSCAEAHAVESLLESITVSPSITRLGAFFGTGLVGMIAHYLNRWSRGEFVGNLLDYAVHKNPQHTVAAIMALGTATSVAFATNQLDAMPMGAFLMSAFGTGYTCDSTVNHGGTLDLKTTVE